MYEFIDDVLTKMIERAREHIKLLNAATVEFDRRDMELPEKITSFETVNLHLKRAVNTITSEIKIEMYRSRNREKIIKFQTEAINAEIEMDRRILNELGQLSTDDIVERYIFGTRFGKENIYTNENFKLKRGMSDEEFLKASRELIKSRSEWLKEDIKNLEDKRKVIEEKEDDVEAVKKFGKIMRFMDRAGGLRFD